MYVNRTLPTVSLHASFTMSFFPPASRVFIYPPLCVRPTAAVFDVATSKCVGMRSKEGRKKSGEGEGMLDQSLTLQGEERRSKPLPSTNRSTGYAVHNTTEEKRRGREKERKRGIRREMNWYATSKRRQKKKTIIANVNGSSHTYECLCVKEEKKKLIDGDRNETCLQLHGFKNTYR